MKRPIDVVTGFLGSGKTTFINKLLTTEPFLGKKILILQFESGEIEIDSDLVNSDLIEIVEIAKNSKFEPQSLWDTINRHSPERIIIENNGMSNLNNLIALLKESNLDRGFEIDRVINLIDASTFQVYINNLGSLIREQIFDSDSVIINHTQEVEKNKLDDILQGVKAINRSAELFVAPGQDDLTKVINDGFVSGKNTTSQLIDKGLNTLLALVTIMFIYRLGRYLNWFPSVDQIALQDFSTVFISILLQAFPFILFGVFISAVIQLFISVETITKLFPVKKAPSFLVAVVAGFFFPTCDCAIIPVASRLVKKGVPLPAAITFMLSAPIVNPVVIASTIYAFPQSKTIALYRVLIGLLIAVVVGVLYALFPPKDKVLSEGISNAGCECGYCNEDSVNTNGLMGRTKAVFKHAGNEFFDVSQYLIIGAFLSTIVQTFIPKSFLATLGGNNVSGLLIMMFVAFFLSICSTSDAFIARSFLGQFSMGSVMGFMVLGPMIDIKNVLMLFGSFKKRFVIKLILTVLAVSFIFLYIFSIKIM